MLKTWRRRRLEARRVKVAAKLDERPWDPDLTDELIWVDYLLAD